MNDLLPLNTKVYYNLPSFGGRHEGVIVAYNERRCDSSVPVDKFPYIVQWNDGVRDIVGNTSLSLRKPLNFKTRIR